MEVASVQDADKLCSSKSTHVLLCGVETLLAIFHCCILAVFVESKGGMRYYALVVLYAFGQTEQKDPVFQL